MRRFTLVALVITAVVLTGVVMWTRQRSPEHALAQLGAALQQHDLDGVEARLDIRQVAEDLANEYARQVSAPRDVMVDIRAIATAIEAYASDTNRYPDVPTYDKLVSLLAPKYARELPKQDPWGTPYCYTTDSQPVHFNYRIGSAGSDKSFEASSCRFEQLKMGPNDARPVADPGDVLFQNGIFVTYPASMRTAPARDQLAPQIASWRDSLHSQLRRLIESAADPSGVAEPSIATLLGLRSTEGTAEVRQLETHGNVSKARVALRTGNREVIATLRLVKGEGGWRVVGVENIREIVLPARAV